MKVSTPLPPRPTLPPGFTRARALPTWHLAVASPPPSSRPAAPRYVFRHSLSISQIIHPSIHPSSRRRPTSITSRIFPSQLLCFPRLHALAQTTSQFPLKTRALEISSGPSPPPRYSHSAASDFIKLVRKHISSSSALLFHAPLCRPGRGLALISEERARAPCQRSHLVPLLTKEGSP